MSPHQILVAVFVAHGLDRHLVGELEEFLLARIAPQSKSWWTTPMEPAASAKYQALVEKISGSSKDCVSQRETVMRGLLLKLHGGDPSEADAAWKRLNIHLLSRN